MQNWDIPTEVERIDLKANMISSDDLAIMYGLTKSYEVLFSKRSQRFQSQGLMKNINSDEDYGILLPQDYTFLKRPILVYDDHIFVGNSPKTDQDIQLFFAQLKN